MLLNKREDHDVFLSIKRIESMFLTCGRRKSKLKWNWLEFGCRHARIYNLGFGISLGRPCEASCITYSYQPMRRRQHDGVSSLLARPGVTFLGHCKYARSHPFLKSQLSTGYAYLPYTFEVALFFGLLLTHHLLQKIVDSDL